MKKLLAIFLFPVLIMTFGCKKDKSTPQPTYTIVNNGDAGVTSITDKEDQDALAIVQAVPSVSDASYPSSIPIMFFFNDKIFLNSLKDNFTVEQNGKTVGGTITINKAANGYAILTFTPSQAFSVNANITVTIKKDVEDDGGNGLYEDYILTFTTVAGSTLNFDSNKSFESGT
ncbi:MAG TPA: Ig-like domain-containing protein, partial [Ignavibacteria bacterium]